MRRILRAGLVLLLLAAAWPAAAEKQVSTGRGGAVAAEDEIATRVGIEILKKGGNAADAAVAVAFAMAVTWPEAGNIGGGGFWISRDSKGKVLAVDFREVAPRAARQDLFVKARPNGKVPSSTEGPLASGVPGSVAGLSLAHRRAGHLPWKTLVNPAVRLARDGFVVTETFSESIANNKDRLAKSPETAHIFLPNGAPPVPGSVLKQPDLAKTLEAIRDHRDDGFYRGRVARAIEAAHEQEGGLITRGDLARYEAKVRTALKFTFRNAELWTLPAPSGGPVLAEMAMLTEYVGADKLKPRDASSAHLLAEIEKRAFRDRNKYLGDPAFARVRQDLLTDPERLKEIAATIDPSRATPSAALPLPEKEKPSTTHFSVMDDAGGAVAITTTLNDSFGNARVAHSLGFLWNNEMDDFATKPGQPNLYGLIQGETNEVAPGKRMLSAMCPVIAVLNGRNAFVWGTPGGSTIPTTNFQVMLGILLRGESLADAVAAPRFHQQDFPDKIQLERERFDPAFVGALEKLGHTVVEREPKDNPIGRVHAIARSNSGTLTAVADPRRGGAGLVVEPAPPPPPQPAPAPAATPPPAATPTAAPVPTK
ncbi:MAG TPA: gamma-glutamyltransferase [Thermoanaerobaculia bacterium]|nr:gamma-glutamyltransferase [Thermoanaerobaculia bacterium]